MRNGYRNSIVFLKAFIAGIGAQVLSLVIGMVSVPIALDYLGPLQYGIWMVINAILAYLGLSQFGTGTASTALIAKYGEKNQQGKIILGAFRLLCFFALLSLVFIYFAAILPTWWSGLFGEVPSSVKHSAISATIVSLLFYAFRLPTVSVTSAFVGLQEISWERLYVVILPTVFSFLALLFTIYLSGDLLILAFLTGAAQLLASLLAVLHFYFLHKDVLRSNVSSSRSESIGRELVSSGSRFFFISIAAVIVWHTDSLVISYFLGPEFVTSYSVTFRLFTTVFSMLIVGNTVLMPMFARAIGRDDWTWITEIYYSVSAYMMILGGLTWIGGILFSESIILAWAGGSGFGGILAVTALGGYGYLIATANLNANLLSAMNTTSTMLWIGTAEAVINLVLSMLFVRLWGIGGVAVGTFLAAFLTVFLLLPIDVERQTHLRITINWYLLGRHFLFAVFPGVVAAYFLVSTKHGFPLWWMGAGLCVIYLLISLWFLPPQTRSTLTRLTSIRASKFSS